MLTALGPDIEHLLDTVKLAEVSLPSRIYIPLMEIGLLGIDQCTTKKCWPILHIGFRIEVA